MKRLITIAGLILFILVFIWIGWAILMYKIAGSITMPKEIEAFGQWGDTFGSLNALFSAFGFSVVAATLYLQHRQNNYNELEQHRQKFDTTFFEILKLLRETRNEVDYEYSLEYCGANKSKYGEKLSGVDAFRAAWEEYAYWYYLRGGKITKAVAGNIYYNKIHKRYESNFGPYFRLIYNTMRRINDDAVLTENQKITYARLLRGQLNSYEAALVGLNGLTKVSKDLSDLVTKFRLLKYLPTKSKRRNLLRNYYPRECFSARQTVKIGSYIYEVDP